MKPLVLIFAIVFGCAGLVVLISYYIIKHIFDSGELNNSAIKEYMDRGQRWNLEGYYNRIILESDKIAKEKLRKKYEPIVLWLLLDGLQINEDGSYKWIQKTDVKKDICIPPTPLSSVLYADNIPIYMTGVENCSVEDRLRMQYAQLQSSLATQMADIRNQVQCRELITAMAKRPPIYDMKPGGSELRKRGDAYGRTFEGEPFYSWAQEL